MPRDVGCVLFSETLEQQVCKGSLDDWSVYLDPESTFM